MTFVAIVLMCLIWGLTWIAIKIGLEDLPPLLSAGVRFVLACAILWPVVLLRNLPLPKKWPEIRTILIPGFFIYGINYALVYWGEQYIGAGLASILFSSLPFLVALFAHYMLPNEKMTFVKLTGLTCGFSGIVLVFYGGLSFGPDSYLGMLALLGSSLSAAYANILVKRDLHATDPMLATALQMSLGAFLLLGLGTLTESWQSFHLTPKAVGTLLYLSIFGSAVAFSLYFWALKKTEATKLSLIAFVTPLVALVGGYLILDEPITGRLAAGSILVLAGIVIVNYFSSPGKKRSGA
ncbi:MAG TPA: EamA family transporter [candidate division Zixibacteria bacterium]|nr:EamA family transporter [candidate division Zixibacteria bacterium]